MKLFLYLMVFVFAACNHAAKTNDTAVKDTGSALVKRDSVTEYTPVLTDTSLENKITNALMKLPFVIESNDHIDSFSNHRHGIAFILDEPLENETDISVKAGYNGGERFETYYRFFVNPKTMDIKVYDPAADEKLTVSAYLKSKQ